MRTRTRPMRLTTRALAVLLAVVVSWLAAPVGVPAALATTTPQPVAAVFSDTRQSGTSLSGVVTLHSNDELQIDAASVRAVVDGEGHAVTVQPIVQRARRTMLVIDTSGSMGVKGMATVRSAVASFLAVAPRDVLVGVLSFAKESRVVLAPTKDRSAVARAVSSLTARGDTSLYRGVRDGVVALGLNAERSIVLLSDGADTSAATTAGDLAATVAAVTRAGVRVEVIRFRTTDRRAAAALKAFAGAGGGSVVVAEDPTGVTRAFAAAARALDSQAQLTIADVSPGHRHDVRITGVASGRPFSAALTVGSGLPPVPVATISVTPAPIPAPAPTPAPVAPSIATGWYAVAAAVAIFAAILLFAVTVLGPALRSPRDERLAAIEQFVVVGPARATAAAPDGAIASVSKPLVRFGDKVMGTRRSATRTVTLLRRADLPLRAGEWWVLCFAAVVTATAIGAALFRAHPIAGAVIGLVAGALVPPLVLRLLATRRANAFEASLPDLLIIVSTSLSSGFSLPQALDSAARDASGPTATEFSRALAESRIGVDISDALEHVSERMDSESLRWAVMAIRIQREVGGSLAETLRTTAQTLRERASLHRQMRTLSAEGRLSAYILVSLPIGLLLYSMVRNYGYVSLLWTTPLGLIMSTVAILLMLIGIFWMSRVVRIEA